MTGRVERVELLGPEALAEFSIGADRLTARLRVDQVPPVGTDVGLSIDERRMRLFNADSGQAINFESV